MHEPRSCDVPNTSIVAADRQVIMVGVYIYRLLWHFSGKLQKKSPAVAELLIISLWSSQNKKKLFWNFTKAGMVGKSLVT